MAEKTKLLVLGIGTICPKCKSNQFSISVPSIRPDDWPRNVLGSADCRGCNGEFLVKFASELENALMEIAEGKSWTMFARPDGVNVVRQFVKYLLFGKFY